MSTNILHDFIPEPEFAKRHKVTRRTVKRYREQGLAHVEFGGKIYIGPMTEAREWLESRIRRPNPPRIK